MKAVLTASGICKSFKNRIVLKNLNLSLFEDECLGITGENGSGKTILLFILLGLIKPNKGLVVYFGRHAVEEEYVRQKINVVHANSRLYMNFSPYYNIVFFSQLYGKKMSHSQITNLLESYDLVKFTKNRKITMAQVSNGENAKIQLIKAFINSPKIVFLDEPTAHLDVRSQANFIYHFKNLRKKKKFSCILISHSQSEIKTLCDRILVLKKGSLFNA